MRRFLKHIALFILALAPLYLTTVWAVGKCGLGANVKYIPGNYGMMGLRLAEADGKGRADSPDLLFVGSSHCYRTFDTRVYNLAGNNCFNLGSSNQTPRQTYALLERYLRRLSPQLVVIEVHPDIMANSGNESALDLLSNTRIDAPMRRMAWRQKDLRVFNTMCCSWVDRLLHGGNIDPGDSVVNVGTTSGDTMLAVDFRYISGGFVEVTPYCYKPTTIKPTTIAVRDDQMKGLEDCIALLDDYSIPYLLVEVPSTRCRYASYTNHADFEQKMRSLVSKDGEYLNLNEDRRLMSQLDDTTCFFDDDHLNRKGVDIFNKFFLQCILSD